MNANTTTLHCKNENNLNIFTIILFSLLSGVKHLRRILMLLRTEVKVGKEKAKQTGPKEGAHHCVWSAGRRKPKRGRQGQRGRQALGASGQAQARIHSSTWAKKSLRLRTAWWNRLTSNACTCWRSSCAPALSLLRCSGSEEGWTPGGAAGSAEQPLEPWGISLAFSLGPNQGCRRLTFSLFCWVPPDLEDWIRNSIRNLEKYSQDMVFTCHFFLTALVFPFV